jgi:hypothetical protein
MEKAGIDKEEALRKLESIEKRLDRLEARIRGAKNES